MFVYHWSGDQLRLPTHQPSPKSVFWFCFNLVYFNWRKLYVYTLDTKLLYNQCLINLKYDLQSWKLNLVSLVNRDDCDMESRRSKKKVWYENNPKVFYLLRFSVIGRRFEMSSNISFLVVLSCSNNLDFNPARDLYIVISFVNYRFALLADRNN